MPFAYICSPGSVVRRAGDSLTVTPPGDATQAVHLHAEHLTALILVGRVSVSAQAQAFLLRRALPLAFISRRGVCLGRLEPAQGPAVELRIAQRRLLDNSAQRLPLARRIITAKVKSMLELIRTHRGNHPAPELASLTTDLEARAKNIDAAPSIAALLGVEGIASRQYFRALSIMNRSLFPFSGRRRRPPPDPINAMLSFGYTLLANEAHALAGALGLDPFLGALHDPSPRRPALAMDLIEPFRHAIVDRFVLSAVNSGQFSDRDFERSPGSVRFNPAALRRFLTLYEGAMAAPAPPSVALTAEEPARLALLARTERVASWIRSHDPGESIGKAERAREAA